MGRPSSHSVEYIPHYLKDSETVEMLQNKYGMLGYCFFWKLLEILGRKDFHYYDAGNAGKMEFLSRKCLTDPVSASEIIKDMCLWGKLDSHLWSYGVIFSPGFVSHLTEVYKKRKSELPTVEKVCEILGISAPETTGNTEFPRRKLHQNEVPVEFLDGKNFSAPETLQSKVKESKVKESKEDSFVVLKRISDAETLDDDEFFEKFFEKLNSDTIQNDEIIDAFVRMMISKGKLNESPEGYAAKMRLDMTDNPKKVSGWVTSLLAFKVSRDSLKLKEQNALKAQIAEQEREKNRLALLEKKSEAKKILKEIRDPSLTKIKIWVEDNIRKTTYGFWDNREVKPTVIEEKIIDLIVELGINGLCQKVGVDLNCYAISHSSKMASEGSFVVN